MIELQNVNPRLRAGGNVKKRNWYLILGMLLLVQLIAIFYFGSKKAGFHYDEYYSYYSSNVSIGLVPTDREWKPGSEIADEFRVLPGQRFQYGTVTRMQTYDVHPPFYYLLLHTVCSLFPGRFSKWSGIGLNIVLFVLSWSVLAKLTRWIVMGALRSAAAPGGKAQTCVTAADVPERITRVMIFGVCLLYGFNPAVYSGVMLVRMYMLLALWILLVTWLHVKSLQERKRGFSFYLPLMAVVYLGFLTYGNFLRHHAQKREHETCGRRYVRKDVTSFRIGYGAPVHLFNDDGGSLQRQAVGTHYGADNLMSFGLRPGRSRHPCEEYGENQPEP